MVIGEKEFRMKSAKVKADQVKATGARILSTACENCHSQLTDLNEHYQLGTQVEFLSNLVAEALVKESAAKPEPEKKSASARLAVVG